MSMFRSPVQECVGSGLRDAEQCVRRPSEAPIPNEAWLHLSALSIGMAAIRENGACIPERFYLSGLVPCAETGSEAGRGQDTGE